MQQSAIVNVRRDLPSQPFRGIKPFRYADRNIFSAREWEKEQLLNLIALYRGCLVYGASGIGKSSLINAGLIPVLEENNFQAEIIRVYPDREGTFTIYKIDNADTDNTYLPSLFDPFVGEASRSEISISLVNFKKVIFSTVSNNKSNNRFTPIPVLIFDQFEELITLFEETIRSGSSKECLSFSEREKLQFEIISFLQQCYYNPEIHIKIVFIFREDYLAKFTRLFRAIPDLRDHVLRIKAIARADIPGIVLSPFVKEESAEVYPNKFTADFSALVSEKLTEYFGDEDASLTEIQIVCQYLYETDIHQRNEFFFRDGQEEKEPIKKVIQLFYARLLGSLPEKDKPLAIEILLLLVLNEHTRNIFHGRAIVDELRGEFSEKDIETVLSRLDNDTRLIRSEGRRGGTYYEINSESLIPYINDLKRKREKLEIERELNEKKERNELLEKEVEQAVAAEVTALKSKQRLRWVLIIILGILFCVAAVYALSEYSKSKDRKSRIYLMAAVRASSPTLGYSIAQDALKSNKRHTDLNSYISSFKRRNTIAYISNILFYPRGIIGIFFAGNDTIGIVGDERVDYFGINGEVLAQKPIDNIICTDHSYRYYVSRNADSPQRKEIRKHNGELVATFLSYPNSEVFAIAPDEGSFFVDGSIYKIGENLPKSTIKEPDQCQDLWKAVYSGDGKYIIAAYRIGPVVVYDLEGRIIRAFSPGEDSEAAVSSLDVTSDFKYLVIGDLSNNVRIFKLDLSLRSPKNVLQETDIDKRPEKVFLLSYSSKGQIGSITVSPDNSSFLATDEHQKAVMLNFSGDRLAVLKGHKANIESAIFSPDGKKMVTYTSSGKVFIWKNESIIKGYAENNFAVFSPFEYRSVGLAEYGLGEVYKDTATAQGLLSSALNYLASLPDENSYLEDENFMKMLDTSLKEIHLLFQKLFLDRNFNLLSNLNKKLIYNSYSFFKLDSIALTGKQFASDSERLVYRIDLLSLDINAALIDTVDVSRAIYIGRTLRLIGMMYADSSMYKNYRLAIMYLRKGTDLLKAFRLRHGSNRELSQVSANAYGTLSWYLILTKQYDQAILAAQQGLSEEGNEWINTNLALGYLMTGRYTEAESIYRKYRSESNNNRGISLKDEFLIDFKDLENEGLISKTNISLFGEVRKIKGLLGEK